MYLKEIPTNVAVNIHIENQGKQETLVANVAGYDERSILLSSFQRKNEFIDLNKYNVALSYVVAKKNYIWKNVTTKIVQKEEQTYIRIDSPYSSLKEKPIRSKQIKLEQAVTVQFELFSCETNIDAMLVGVSLYMITLLTEVRFNLDQRVRVTFDAVEFSGQIVFLKEKENNIMYCVQRNEANQAFIDFCGEGGLVRIYMADDKPFFLEQEKIELVANLTVPIFNTTRGSWILLFSQVLHTDGDDCDAEIQPLFGYLKLLQSINEGREVLCDVDRDDTILGISTSSTKEDIFKKAKKVNMKRVQCLTKNPR